ncbi:MAG: hypothetical protein Q9188_003007 [Gyalolechia gomerana]
MADHFDMQDGQIWSLVPDSLVAAPVVLCDDELVELYFGKAADRPKNARKADGTWPDGFGPGEPYAGFGRLPAMYLGSLRKVWAPRGRLQLLTMDMAVLERDSNPNPALAQAYGEVVELNGRQLLQYYKDLLLAKQLKDEEDANGGEGSSSGPSTKRKTVEAPSRLDNDASDDEDLEAYVAKVKQEVSGKEKDLSLIPAALQEEEVQDYGPDAVKVYVGNPYTIYIIQRSNLEPSPVLSRLVNFDSASGYYVMSPLLSSISAGDFKAVAQYLEYKEYYPPIFDAEIEHAYLEGLQNHEDGLEAIGQCGVVAVVAQKLEMPELQALAVSKFKALQPFPASHFLAVTGLLFGSGLVREGPMYEFVIEYLAHHFQELRQAQRDLADELLTDYPHLATTLGVRVTPDLQVIPNPTAVAPSQVATPEHEQNRHAGRS